MGNTCADCARLTSEIEELDRSWQDTFRKVSYELESTQDLLASLTKKQGVPLSGALKYKSIMEELANLREEQGALKGMLEANITQQIKCCKMLDLLSMERETSHEQDTKR